MIKEILDKLKDSERRRLLYAFENNMSQYIEVGSYEFVGVNVEQCLHLRIVESSGLWSYGFIKGEQDAS